MGRFLLFRIDNRLIHGQVCTVWIPQNKVKRVVVIHDDYAKQPMLIELHKSVVPHGVVCDTLSTEDAVAQWNEDEFGDKNTIVIFQKPDHALKALNAGLSFDQLQLATLAGDKGAVTVYKQVNVDRENAAALKALDEKGVNVYCQMYATDKPEPVMGLLQQPKVKEKLNL